MSLTIDPRSPDCPSRVYLDRSHRSWIDIGHLPRDLIDTATATFPSLFALHPVERGLVRVYGKEVESPRWHQSYGYSYRFSGVDHPALPVPAQFQPYLDHMNSTLIEGQPRYNMILANWYETGHHYIAAHSDDERSMPDGSSVVTISLGGDGEVTRIFRIKPRKNCDDAIYNRLDVILRHGSVVTMCGDMQKRFTHEVPKITGRVQPPPRISLTLRTFV